MSLSRSWQTDANTLASTTRQDQVTLHPRAQAWRGHKGDSDTGEAGCLHAAARGLWGLQGHSQLSGGSCHPGLFREIPSPHISWQLIHVLDYDDADKIKYIHRPPRNQRKKASGHQTQISEKLGSPPSYAIGRGGWVWIHALGAKSLSRENNPDTPGRGGAQLRSRVGATPTHDGLL